MPSTSNTLSAQYQEDGFLIMENLLAREDIESLRQRIIEIGEGRVSGFPASNVEFEPDCDGSRNSAVRKINQCAECDNVFLRQASNPQILNIVEQLIGGDIKLFASQCFMKPPGGVAKPYHQDSAYFTIEPKELVTCWIALDDVTVENGCVFVIPGSHRGELFDHSQPWEVGGRMDMQVPDEMIDWASETPITMLAGSCSFHHSMLLHRSGPNNTDNHRRGFAIHYMPSQARWTHPTQAKPEYLLLRGQEYEDCV